HGRIKDKFEPVVRSKMEQYPAEIVGITICDDDTEMIAKAAEKHLADGADMLIFTGGMSVDPDDVTPAAIRALGAEIVSHGVPSQPGNMTLVAYLNDVAILGVPGAAISLPTTIFDVLLPQIFAGIKLTKEDLINLGNGGLCQLCAACHWPNCTFGRY
ncbi:MAG: molybdopterin-binding protein, partial [Firmicutes bacterium]|nr:molybdopterin-binding protein [Bacillota bacterium]